MEIAEILKQPDGFTPPETTIKIKKIWEYKSGTSKDGPWSFQNVEVEGGQLKLKGLPEFPKTREGQTVTLKANHSKQHGLTGLKVSHEEYKGKKYDQLLVTPSANWEWANGAEPATQTAKEQAFDRSQFRRGRVERMREAIEDAFDAVRDLGEFDSDDIRSIAISFVIEEQRERIPMDLPETVTDKIGKRLRELSDSQDGMKDLMENYFGTRSWSELLKIPQDVLEASLVKLDAHQNTDGE